MSDGDVRERLAALSAAAWTATAVGVAIELGVPARLREPTGAEALASGAGLPVPLAAALAEALVAAGLARRTDGGFVGAPALVALTDGPAGRYVQAETRAGLLQMAAFFDAATRGAARTGWAHADERILDAQGTMSAGAIETLERDVLPWMTGLGKRLDSGRGAFLDVGAGVGAVTLELCRRHPALRAVALEPLDAARHLAERNVADAGLADRVHVRGTRIEDLDAHEEFDLVWLPGNFLGPDLLPGALATVHRALRPGGYVVNASLGSAGDDEGAVTARLRAILWAGDTVEPERVAGWMKEAGFCEVVLMPRQPNGLVPMRARKPSIA
ncbi:SAM-dependent methyltransferase [Patulibacter americanus]|uniref:SAM-dependent methyltransferase n=1 Tax=Patulibacter americanus TaxID=588672 RepID=UPI0003B48804|nr:class I SAM-dependent methyltransferase [Patulibacter americanus]